MIKEVSKQRINVRKITKLTATKRVQQSVAYVVLKRGFLGKYEDLEDYAFKNCDTCPPELKGFEHHFVQIRASLARHLWASGLFIGTNVLDTLLFWAIRDPTVTDPISCVLKQIKDFGLHRPGFVVYPIHSLGFCGEGVKSFFTQTDLTFVDNKAGIVLIPQIGSESKVASVLQQAAKSIDIDKKIRTDLVEHYMRSRPTKWLYRNPLMVVRTQSFSQDYYENQRLLCVHLYFATATIFMYGVVAKIKRLKKMPDWSSSSRTNQWQTLDIHHYLVFQRPIRTWLSYLDGKCIPMNISQTDLAELSDLNMEIDPRGWHEKPAIVERVLKAIKTVERGYLCNCVSIDGETTSARVFRKIHLSLGYFKRSFRSRTRESEMIISLAIAFETLLMDNFAPGMTARLRKRVRTLLKDVRGRKAMAKAVKDLFESRGAIVHTGTTEKVFNKGTARKAYVYCFLALSDKLPEGPMPDTGEPIKLLGGFEK